MHMHKENKMTFPAIYHETTYLCSVRLLDIKRILLKVIRMFSFRELVSQWVKNHSSGLRRETRVGANNEGYKI